jgi:hypothetical protein
MSLAKLYYITLFSYRAHGYDNRYDRGYDYYDDGYNGHDDHYDGRDPYYDDYYSRNRASRQRQEAPPPKKSGGSGGAALSIILRVLFIILLIAFLILPQAQPYREKFFEYIMDGMYKYQEIPDRVEFSVERTFQIETNGKLNYTLFLPIPQNLEIDGYMAQELKDAEFSPRYSEKLGGEDDQWVWHDSFTGRGSDTITVVYYFETTKIKWDISIKKSGTIDDIPSRILDRWGGDQWPVKDYQDVENSDQDNDGIDDVDDVDDNNDGKPDKYRIEPSNPYIRNLLLTILTEAKLYSGSSLSEIGDLNVYEVVKAIYDYIDKNCIYPTEQQMYDDAITYGSYPKWATGTWNDKRGDCDDQSILFISLCRAAGIPAMLEIGALYDPTFDHWEGHGWANVYIPYSDDYADEKGVDHVTPMVDIVNNIFLFRDPNRFSEWVDTGVKGALDPDTGEWEPSALEKRYLAWEYTRASPSVSVDISEDYLTLEFKAFPPEKKIYL